MFHNAFGMTSEEIQKFQGFYLEEMRTAGSGTSEADIMTGGHVGLANDDAQTIQAYHDVEEYSS